MDNPFNRLVTKEDIEDILNRFGNLGQNGERLQINNLEPYQTAFVHESYYMSVVKNVLHTNKNKNDSTQINDICLNYVPKCSNERLEFLGDHILKTCIGYYLFKRFGEEREGFLTRLKIKIERTAALHQIALALGFKKFLLLSSQVENETVVDNNRGRNTFTYYEDAFEAFFGAIVQDFGIEGIIIANKFIENLIENVIDFSELISTNDNFKDSIQRFFQTNHFKNTVYTPVYEHTSLYNQKIFIKAIFLTTEQLQVLDPKVQQDIKDYTVLTVSYYKTRVPQVFETLMEKISEFPEPQYVLSLAQAKKVILCEQECAKVALINLGLDLNY